MQREYPDRPIVGVGAVVVQNGRVLLVKRGGEPLKGEWSLPGGVLELGETLQQAVEREVREETGLQVRVLEVLDIFDRIVPGTQGRVQFHYVLIDYLCEPIGGSLQAGGDAEEVRWSEEAELSVLGVATVTEQLIHKALREMRERASA